LDSANGVTRFLFPRNALHRGGETTQYLQSAVSEQVKISSKKLALSWFRRTSRVINLRTEDAPFYTSPNGVMAICSAFRIRPAIARALSDTLMIGWGSRHGAIFIHACCADLKTRSSRRGLEIRTAPTKEFFTNYTREDRACNCVESIRSIAGRVDSDRLITPRCHESHIRSYGGARSTTLHIGTPARRTFLS